MVTIGIDAHKRSHTVVAVDDRGGSLRNALRERRRRIISSLLVGRPALLSGAGRSRTAGICLVVSSEICSRLASGSSGCRRS